MAATSQHIARVFFSCVTQAQNFPACTYSGIYTQAHSAVIASSGSRALG